MAPAYIALGVTGVCTQTTPPRSGDDSMEWHIKVYKDFYILVKAVRYCICSLVIKDASWEAK